ncbi:MAG: hypothetical protein ABL921_20920 [Pirellula sp.]
MFHSWMLSFVWVVLNAVTVSTGDAEVLTREIRIVDESGAPVVNATADCWLINEKYFWPTEQVPRVPVNSDANGIARLKYPKTADYDEAIPIESVKLTVAHANFRSKDVVVPVGGKNELPFEIKIEPGISLTIKAIDDEGKALTEPFAVMTSRMGSVQRWNRPSPGVVNCRSMSEGNRQIMLVQPKQDGRHRFSDVLNYRFQSVDKQNVVLEDIELHSGVSIRGRLSGKVPRPVHNGWVIAVHIPLPAGDSWDEALPSLLYYDSVDVKPDGSFEFVSMPPSGTIQLISGCDGWVGLQEQKQPFIVGESFDVEDKALDVELQMTATFDAKIRIVDKDGNPVQGVIAACSPSQLFKKGGSTLLGDRFSSYPSLKAQLEDDPRPTKDKRAELHRGISDKSGTLTIRNLPRNRWSSNFTVWGPKTSSVKIKSQDSEGKLPPEGEGQVEFDIVVTLLDK